MSTAVGVGQDSLLAHQEAGKAPVLMAPSSPLSPSRPPAMGWAHILADLPLSVKPPKTYQETRLASQFPVCVSA